MSLLCCSYYEKADMSQALNQTHSEQDLWGSRQGPWTPHPAAVSALSIG